MKCVGDQRWIGRRGATTVWLLAFLALPLGCDTVRQTDQDVAALITARQRAALGDDVPVNVGANEPGARGDASAYEYNPRPTTIGVPSEFEAPATTSQPTSQPTSRPTTRPTRFAASRPSQQPATSQPTTRRAQVFTLTDSLAYAQQHRREYQSAKETLYLVALNLTLERHLWTPIFASHLRTVYGNYGEVRDFDQAMRFVADLSVAQRLPYGGEFTAEMISTLIRDVGHTITASEDSSIQVGATVPFLRGAGHVAQEQLIQLERNLTYAVRSFERFRRQQLVTVAQSYFDLLRTKQQVLDSIDSLRRAEVDLERAQKLEVLTIGDPLDTMRAEQRLLSAEASVENTREAFRSQADQFKITIGMSVDEPLTMDDLENIESIERQIAAGLYPLLRRPPAVEHETYAVNVALERRFDLLTAEDRIDDARRGVTISRNAMLPDLNWTGSVTWDTDPEQYRLGGFSVDRTTWRTELLFELPLERTAERNELRRSLIDVRQAERAEQDLSERIRAEVRRTVNQIYLAETSLRIQERNVQVAEMRAWYANYRYEEIGDISNRDKVEAENELLNAKNELNLAKTTRWNALLQFRLSTETLRIDEQGQQEMDPAMP